MLDTNQYRTRAQFRVNQLLDEKLSDATRLHIADVALGLVANLCDEIDTLRQSRARVEAEAAETISALRAEIAANEAAMERMIGENIAAGADLDTERSRVDLRERLLAGAEAEVARLRAALEYAEHKCDQAAQGRAGALDAALWTVRDALAGRVEVINTGAGFLVKPTTTATE